MAAVEALGHPQDRGERAHRLSLSGPESGEFCVRLAWHAATVVPGNQSDRFNLVRRKAAQVAVLHEVIRMPVMAGETDVRADVVEQGGVLEPFALAVAQAVHVPGLVE